MAWAADERQQLVEHLTMLGEYYDKHVSDKALTFWSDQLKGSTPWAVLSVLDDWAKTEGKFPVLKDVIRRANERVSQRLEEQSKRDAVQTQRLDKIKPADPAILEAQKRFYAARRNLPRRGRDFNEMLAVLHYVTERPVVIREWEVQPDGSIVRTATTRSLSTIKLQSIIAKYGEQPASDLVEKFRQIVNTQLEAERAAPKFREILAQVREEAAACIA